MTFRFFSEKTLNKEVKMIEKFFAAEESTNVQQSKEYEDLCRSQLSYMDSATGEKIRRNGSRRTSRRDRTAKNGDVLKIEEDAEEGIPRISHNNKTEEFAELGARLDDMVMLGLASHSRSSNNAKKIIMPTGSNDEGTEFVKELMTFESDDDTINQKGLCGCPRRHWLLLFGACVIIVVAAAVVCFLLSIGMFVGLIDKESSIPFTAPPSMREPSTAPSSKPTLSPVSRHSGEIESTPKTSRLMPPTQVPTRSPTRSPTQTPTNNPTKAPSKEPTKAPTEVPTEPAVPVAAVNTMEPSPFVVFNTEGLYEAVDTYLWSIHGTDSENSPFLTSNQAFDFYAIGSWDVSRINDFSNLFDVERNELSRFFNANLSAWDVSKGTDMYEMFRGAEMFDQDLSSWVVSKVTNMNSLFEGASTFSSDLSSWNVSNVEDMSNLFSGALLFDGDVSTWDVSNVKHMGAMFKMATKFNGDISAWNVESVGTMRQMFNDASSFAANLSTWKVSNVRNMRSMFDGASAFNGDLSLWDVSATNTMQSMFKSSAFNQNLCAWGTVLPTNGIFVQDMFWGTNCQDLSDPILSTTPAGPFCYSCTQSK